VIYENNNVKAIKFGEAILRQWAGQIRSLRGKYEGWVADGSWNMGGLAKRHQGMSTAERRQALLGELVVELDTMERKYRDLNSLVTDLKETLEKYGDTDDEFIRLMCLSNREGIARLTGDNPRKYVED
jgi:hypothetical protein